MSQTKTATRIVRTILILALLIAVIWLNATTLMDAYGPGPPYFGRTSNMDKWTNPLHWLLPLDVVCQSALNIDPSGGVIGVQF
ncbi:hypothetical protein [Agrobacterium cavarae]|uniref:hypothetical protein n=1 Tax=Agrobacterium cavarae TaxID=2528239 RepID=UPI003EE6B430